MRAMLVIAILLIASFRAWATIYFGYSGTSFDIQFVIEMQTDDWPATTD